MTALNQGGAGLGARGGAQAEWMCVDGVRSAAAAVRDVWVHVCIGTTAQPIGTSACLVVGGAPVTCRHVVHSYTSAGSARAAAGVGSWQWVCAGVIGEKQHATAGAQRAPNEARQAENVFRFEGEKPPEVYLARSWPRLGSLGTLEALRR